jgi:hypothetical protein
MTKPVHWLRLEGAAALAVSLALYAAHGGGWVLAAVLFLAPDLSMIGYAGGRRVGALAYNVFHTYALPLPLAAAAWILGQPLLLSIALIWSAHIGFDRLLGYGLKADTGFRDTHLGQIGGGAAAVLADAARPAAPGPTGAAADSMEARPGG